MNTIWQLLRPLLIVSWSWSFKESLSTIYDTDMLQNSIFIQRSIMRKIPCNLRMKSLRIWTQSKGKRMSGSFMHCDFWCKWPLHQSCRRTDGWPKEGKRRHVWGSAKTGSSSPVQFTYWDGNGTLPPALWALFLHPLPIHPHSVYPQPNPAVSETSDKSFIQNITPHDWQNSVRNLPLSYFEYFLKANP